MGPLDVEDLRDRLEQEARIQRVELGRQAGPVVAVLDHVGRDGRRTFASEGALEAGVLEDAAVVVIASDHSRIDYQLVGERAGLVVDTRNAMKDIAGPGAVIIKA